MRTVTYGAACSLDGFIAGPDGSIDWLHFSRDAQQVMAAYWATIDAVLMGRKTWEVAATQSPGGGGCGGQAIATYVFLRTLRGHLPACTSSPRMRVTSCASSGGSPARGSA